MKTRFGKRIVALAGVIAVTLSLLPAALPAMAKSGEQKLEPQAVGAPQVTQGGTARPENALSDDAYRDFGFQSLPDQDAFTSNENPLNGFEGAALSQLYVGYMNKNKSQQGSYAVYGAMPRRSAQGAAISGNGSSGYLDANPVSRPMDYQSLSGGPVEDGKYRTLNSVSLDMGTNSDGSGGKREVICESILLTGKERNVQNAKTASWLCVRTLVNTGNGYVPVNTDYIKLKENDKSIDSIDVRAAQGLTAVAAGDYDGDGADELAVYVPDFYEPYIRLYDVGEDGGLTPGAKIELNELAAPNDPFQYRFGFKNGNLPIVNLTTAGLSRGVTGKDSLVISACLPRTEDKTYTAHSQIPAFAVYENDGNGMKQVFLDHLAYGDYYLRFPAAVEADVNGSGTSEIVVAGYADTWMDTRNEKSKDHPFGKYCVNMLTYDEEAKTYRMAYTKPLEFTPTGDVKKVMAADSGYAMSEPVALTAAALSEAANHDYLFLEGAVLSFNEGANVKKDDSEQMRLAGGSLTSHMEMNMTPSAVTVSHAVSGRFAADRPESEQIALVWNDNYSQSSAVADANITWIWMENNAPRQYDANCQYLKGRDADGSGTFLSLAKVNDTASRVSYKYKSKSYGWSAPGALAALPAVPYWEELPYENGVGGVTFSVGNEREGSPGADMGVSLGATGSITAMAGAGALGNKALGGLTVDLDASVESAAHMQAALSVDNTQTFRAPGDKNHVLVYATPMVTYQYEVWLPAFTVTVETAQKYKELTGSDTLKNEDGTVYGVGDTVPAGWYGYNLHVPYSPAFSLITMDQYNEAYAKHALGTGEIDMSAYDFTVGDPTTYKTEFSAIPHYDSQLSMRSREKYVMVSTNNQIDFTGSEGLSGGLTANLAFDSKVKGKIEEEVQLGGSEKIEYELGGTQGLEENVGFHAGFNVNLGTGASTGYLPSGYGQYTFTTIMGVWPCVGSGALLTTGFIVKEKPEIPPTPPESPYVYETGVQEDGNAFMTLAWEKPKGTEYRLAQAYEVFYKNAGADAYSYTSLGTVESLKQNFMRVTGLTPGATYDFAFKPLLPGGKDGGLSKPLTATTAKANTLTLTATKPEDVNVDAGGTAAFAVEATDSEAGNTISYQWQRYEADGGYLGAWQDIPGANNASYDVTNAAQAMDGTKYRCVVTSEQGGSPHSAAVQTVMSRTATLHIGTDPRFSVSLTAQAAGGGALPRENGGAYFLSAGGKVALKTEVTKTGVPSIGDGTVSLYCRMDGGAETKIADNLVPVNGVVSHEWTPAQTGKYDLIAVYTAPTTRGAAINNGTNAEQEAAPTVEPPVTPTPAETSSPTPEPTAAPTEQPEPTDAADTLAAAAEMQALSATDGAPEPTAAATGEPSAIPTETPTAAPTEQPTAAPTEQPTQTPEAAPGENNVLGSSAGSALNIAVSDSLSVHAGAIGDEVYVVQYKLDGGENSTANPHAIGRNAMPHELAAPSRVGAAFAGWFEDAGLTTEVTALDPARIASALGGENKPYVLYAKWTPIEYDITYDLDGGINHANNPAKYTVLSGVTLREPEKDGYRFTGWYFDGSSSVPAADVDKTKPVYSLPLMDKKGGWVAADVKVRAEWEAIEYPIIYHTPLAAGKGANPDTYTVEDTVTLNDANYSGHALTPGGWYTDKAFTNKITQIGPHAPGPLALYAKPEFSDAYVFFDVLGGEYDGDNPHLASNPGTITLGGASRQGFKFNVWCEEFTIVNGERVADVSDPNKIHASGVEYKVGEANGRLFSTLYAAWTPAAGQVEIHWLDPADGEEIHLNHGVKGDKIADPGLAPDHYGYAFDGKWYKDKALTQPWNFKGDTVPTNLTGALTLYAGLREAYYTVSFEPNGGPSVPAQRVREGKAATKPADPVIQSQIFLGWYEDEAGLTPYDFASEVQSDITLYAKWRTRRSVKPAPGDSKILGVEDGKEYLHGSRIDFTAEGAGLDNDFPLEGDERHVPKSWSVNPSGTWSGPPYAASFETKDMALGAHTLTVTFALERYENGAWKDTGDTAEAQVSFMLSEKAPEPSPTPGGEPTANPTDGVSSGGGVKTGDKSLPIWIWLVIAVAAAVCLVCLGRKLLKRQ